MAEENDATDSHKDTYSIQNNGYLAKPPEVQTGNTHSKHRHKHKHKSKSVTSAKNSKKNCESNGQHFSVVNNQNSSIAKQNCDKKANNHIKVSIYYF